MTLPVENFSQNKYTYLKDLLDKDTCKRLSNHLKNLTKDMNKGDGQCPLSPSIYGDPVFDEILFETKSKIEEATGLALHPTYSYARFYKPNDELKPHVDRKECEISATITLEYDGDLWPIWLSESTDHTDNPKSYMLEVGDALIYRGMDINHWRKPYKEGNWQCQIFLHYVDANGKYKDFKYDGRENLNVPVKKEPEIEVVKETSHTGSMEITLVEDSPVILPYDNRYWYFGSKQEQKRAFIHKEGILSDGAIDMIVEHGKTQTAEATVGYGADVSVVNKNIRNAHTAPIFPQDFLWLYRQIEKEIYKVNMENYKYVLDKIETLTYIEYHGGVAAPGKYGKHTDGVIHKTRKLSFSILLSDPEEYEGGDLLIWWSDRCDVTPKKKGSIAFFPAYVEHEVTPVTKGIRKSLVGWIHGPHFS